MFYFQKVLRSKLNRIEKVFFFKSKCSNFKSLLGSCRGKVVIEIYRFMFSFFSEKIGTANTNEMYLFQEISRIQFYETEIKTEALLLYRKSPQTLCSVTVIFQSLRYIFYKIITV